MRQVHLIGTNEQGDSLQLLLEQQLLQLLLGVTDPVSVIRVYHIDNRIGVRIIAPPVGPN